MLWEILLMEADNMDKSEKWDDGEDTIMDIFERIEDSKETQIPVKCPICHTYNAHIYMHRWEDGRGTIWTWCSKCKSCAHWSRENLPIWWENAEFIDTSELTSHPVFLEPKAAMVDRHLKKLLDNCH